MKNGPIWQSGRIPLEGNHTPDRMIIKWFCKEVTTSWHWPIKRMFHIDKHPASCLKKMECGPWEWDTNEVHQVDIVKCFGRSILIRSEVLRAHQIDMQMFGPEVYVKEQEVRHFIIHPRWMMTNPRNSGKMTNVISRDSRISVTKAAAPLPSNLGRYFGNWEISILNLKASYKQFKSRLIVFDIT